MCSKHRNHKRTSQTANSSQINAYYIHNFKIQAKYANYYPYNIQIRPFWCMVRQTVQKMAYFNIRIYCVICWLFQLLLLICPLTYKQNLEPTKNITTPTWIIQTCGVGFLFDIFKTIWMFPSSNHVQSPSELKPLHNTMYIYKYKLRLWQSHHTNCGKCGLCKWSSSKKFLHQ